VVHACASDGYAELACRRPNTIFGKTEEGAFPAIPGVSFPNRIHRVFRLDFGETFRSAGIVTIEPPKMGKGFPTLVMQVDKDGNEIAGLKTPQVRGTLSGAR
jgi:hypothetical protein